MIESRTKYATRNIIFSMVVYAVQAICGFLIRRCFLYSFGVDYLGLNSLFANVISLLSLAELGVGAALVFAMYKPMADNDEEKVRELLHFYKISYIIIGCVVALLGLCLVPFMDYFKAKVPDLEVDLYLVYSIFLFNTVISYFFAYRHSLLYVSQRQDIESKVGIAANLLSAGLQLLTIFVFKNYYCFILVSIVTTLFTNLFIFIITQRKFGHLIKKPDKKLDGGTKQSVRKNVFALMFHKIGVVIINGTDSLIIYLAIDSVTLGKYSNYLLITTAVSKVIFMLINAVRGSVGNSIASQTVEHNFKLRLRLNFGFFWLVSFCTICIFVLSNPFIKVILTKGDFDYTLDNIVVLLIACSFYLSHSRQMNELFKECVGIFYQDRFNPLIESAINIVVSIVLVKTIGLAGVIIGTIVSCILVPLWMEPFMMSKYYYKDSVIRYFKLYLGYTAIMIIVGAVTYWTCSLVPDLNLWTLFAKFAICAVVPNVLFAVCYCWTPEFKYFLGLLKGIFRKKHKKLEQVDAMAGESDRLNGEESPSADDALPVEEQEETKHKDENKE